MVGFRVTQILKSPINVILMVAGGIATFLAIPPGCDYLVDKFSLPEVKALPALWVQYKPARVPNHPDYGKWGILLNDIVIVNSTRRPFTVRDMSLKYFPAGSGKGVVSKRIKLRTSRHS